jgi:hypothetical protein
MSKTTLVIGVSSNSNRYANQLVTRLVGIGEGVIPFGRATGTVEGLEILTKWDENWEVDTVPTYYPIHRLANKNDVKIKNMTLQPKLTP